MLLFADNDILLKLGLLGLLPDFIKLFNLSAKQVYITQSTVFSLESQLKKFTYDNEKIQDILNIVRDFEKINNININLLKRLDINNIDSGEAILAAKFIEEEQGFLATGDKRFLVAIKNTEFVECFKHRVCTFELALRLLCDELGYDCVKSRILAALPLLSRNLDGLFKLAFKSSSNQENDFECLVSYTQDIAVFHISNKNIDL